MTQAFLTKKFVPSINTTKGARADMKIKEIVAKTKQVLDVQPSVVAQQQRVGKVVGQIAASDAQMPPTELEKVLAMRSYSELKKRTDRAYAQRLRQQLASAEGSLRSPSK